jgi:hypothetical protein
MTRMTRIWKSHSAPSLARRVSVATHRLMASKELQPARSFNPRPNGPGEALGALAELLSWRNSPSPMAPG